MTKEQVQAARQADLAAWLRGQGYPLVPAGRARDGAEQYRVGEEETFVSGNRWYDFYTGAGGNAVDYLTRVLGVPFMVAVPALAGGAALPATPTLPAARLKTETMRRTLRLPPAADSPAQIRDYLTYRRCLPAAVVEDLLATETIYADIRDNVIWLCYDDGSSVRAAMTEGTGCTRYKGVLTGSDPDYPWAWLPLPIPASLSDAHVAVVAESPVDVLSWAVLHPGQARDVWLVGLGGLKMIALQGFLRRHPKIRRVALALDADDRGRAAAQSWTAELSELGCDVCIDLPTGDNCKDWNDVLIRSVG
jgi:hypothetical protein